MIDKKIYIIIAIAIAVLIITGTIISSTLLNHKPLEKPVTVRFAVEFNDHSSAFWVALDKGWFNEEGINIKYKTFKTGMDLAVEPSKGDIDVALACIGPVLVPYSKGVDVKLVAMTHLNGYSIIAAPGITDVSQLNNTKIAAPGKSSPAMLLLRLFLKKYNIKAEIVKMPPYTAVNALLDGEIAAAALPEPYATVAVERGGVRIIRSQDIWPSMPGSGVFVTEDFLEKHPEVVVKILKVLNRAVEYIKSNMTDATRIVSKYLNMDDKTIYESMKNLNYTLKINKDDISRLINYYVEYGVLNKPIDIDEFVDTSFLEKALGEAK